MTKGQSRGESGGGAEHRPLTNMLHDSLTPPYCLLASPFLLTPMLPPPPAYSSIKFASYVLYLGFTCSIDSVASVFRHKNTPRGPGLVPHFVNGARAPK